MKRSLKCEVVVEMVGNVQMQGRCVREVWCR